MADTTPVQRTPEQLQELAGVHAWYRDMAAGRLPPEAQALPATLAERRQFFQDYAPQHRDQWFAGQGQRGFLSDADIVQIYQGTDPWPGVEAAPHQPGFREIYGLGGREPQEPPEPMDPQREDLASVINRTAKSIGVPLVEGIFRNVRRDRDRLRQDILAQMRGTPEYQEPFWEEMAAQGAQSAPPIGYPGTMEAADLRKRSIAMGNDMNALSGTQPPRIRAADLARAEAQEAAEQEWDRAFRRTRGDQNE